MADPLDQQCIDTLRFLSVDMVQKADSGHPGAADLRDALTDLIAAGGPSVPLYQLKIALSRVRPPVWRRVLSSFEVYTIYAAGQAGKSFDTYGPVSLMVTLDAGTIQLVWQAGTLLQADDLRGPWSAVAGAAPPFFQVTPSAARKFYRVQL